jgi:hypothetical protein
VGYDTGLELADRIRSRPGLPSVDLGLLEATPTAFDTVCPTRATTEPAAYATATKDNACPLRPDPSISDVPSRIRVPPGFWSQEPGA